MEKIKHLLIGLPLVLSAGITNAALINYDFTDLQNNNSIVDVWKKSVSGVTLNITASNRDQSETHKVYLDGDLKPGGIGVYTGNKDSDDLDGGGGISERLNITFDKKVELVALRFTDGDHDYMFDNDDMDFYVDDIKVLDNFDIESHDTFGHVTFSSSWFGSQFGIVADYPDDTFYLSGITIEVSEPGSLALLCLGLASIAAVKRKKIVATQRN